MAGHVGQEALRRSRPTTAHFGAGLALLSQSGPLRDTSGRGPGASSEARGPQRGRT
jgi:hypothetical protein